MDAPFADHPASKKLNDRANALDKIANKQKKDGNDIKSFAKT